MIENDADARQHKPAWSICALLSAVLCAISLVLAVPLIQDEKPSPFLLITTIATLLTAFVALFRVNSGRRLQYGRTLATLALILSVIVLLAIWDGTRPHPGQSAERVICGANLKGLGKKLALYAGENNDTSYPPPEIWCDILVNDYEVHTGNFLCRAARGDKGPSHYAMNPNCKPNSPPKTVLLFETKGGWNQHGGLELVAVRRHGRSRRDSKGFTVLFNNGEVEYCPEEWIPRLNWNAEEPNSTSVEEG